MTNKIILLSAIVSFLFMSCKPPKESNLGQQAETHINLSDSVNFIKRTGNPFEKGRLYGVSLKKDIQGQLDIWKQLVKDELGMSLDELYLLLSEKTGFLSAIKQYTPDLLEEINGMAKGAEVSANDLLCLNLVEETIVYFTNGYQSCTNIGLKGDKANVIVYNLDLPDFLRGFKPVVLQDQEQFIYTIPGIIATGGMNTNFAVTTNSLPELNMDLNGLPLPFTIRKLLEFPNEVKAVEFLKSTPFGAPQNLMIVGRQSVQDFECSANQITKYKNPLNEKVIYHTNHAIVNFDVNSPIKQKGPICERFNYLDSVFVNTTSNNEEYVNLLEQAINNENSNIRYKGNYFSFIGKYPKDSTQPPYIKILLPKLDNQITLLSFDQEN